ncbi:glycoside hydrolase family 2 TIM barrel-domain containing protein [Paenibacillus arenilitoris]|uniref:beta-galactosidase n=1 Tax=Paenibacillus arenilitoris TaxID=2772299 RepID=A0A927H7S4_9BACL|nr:glycoside hydrolase family 2 TIM barrel-domain containing protein [Paenibacillus arenilitoris]MBD2871936.1 beta-glucuronidase [Paenibacillus arenilitoris]
MLEKIGLDGTWQLQLDGGKRGVTLPYRDTIELPNTTSHAGKGEKNESALIGALTDEYAFEGYAWFERVIDVPERLAGKPCHLFLERTRVTTVWIDGREIGTRNSLSTPHRYELADGLEKGRHTVTIRVDNTSYPTKGGHLTSADTQTNWNGITGRMELQFYGEAYLSNVQVYPKPADRAVVVKAELIGDGSGKRVAVSAESLTGGQAIGEQVFEANADRVEAAFAMGRDALLWSDEHPHLYKLKIVLLGEDGERLDAEELTIGLREFKAAGDKFAINGTKTLLRGKHDGLIFPLTGYAPTDVEEWVRVLGIAKSYGINHYRFHTCCPPEAAFVAADMLGVYMEPELPFWGTVTDDTYEKHNQAEQDYLIGEGYAMLRAFGNHPSFVMMSLGNELWGSKSTLNDILKAYKAYDDRHLYTQGSNNFQFVPDILEEEDFFCGVRFSKERLFRGSYAMCDAPQGHVQTDRPGTMKDYDEQIVPTARRAEDASTGGEAIIQIQYGTEAKSVKAEAAGEELIPRIPVLSHEIGQYASYPNFDEIAKYTGPLKARNFMAFRDRLEAKGMGHLADRFFESSGKLAVACYKEELEAAFRSKRLAGFQLLDLQDFSGQGTALVGILDAFMDSKGFVSPEEWRTYCSDTVLLARFEKYNYEAGERFEARIELSRYREDPLAAGELQWELRSDDGRLAHGAAAFSPGAGENHIGICDIRVSMPSVAAMTKALLSLSIPGTDVWKTYDLWIYPKEVQVDLAGMPLFTELTDEAVSLLEQGGDILLLPRPDRASRSIEGTYCTDFWCYPMFRSISESMNKPVPVGTMGLLIDNAHPALMRFPSESHSTYPWWSIVSASRSVILDDMPRQLEPIVQTIDNFERNHKLGLLFECRVLRGRVLMGALDCEAILETPEGRQFLHSVTEYMRSDEFRPKAEVGLDELRSLF